MKTSLLCILLFVGVSCANDNNPGRPEGNRNLNNTVTSRDSSKTGTGQPNTTPGPGGNTNDTGEMHSGSMSGNTKDSGESHYGTREGNNVTGAPAVNRTDTAYRK